MLKRSITGLILGLVIISGLLYSIWTAAIVFLVILIYSCLEWHQHFAIRAGKFASGVFMFSIVLFSLLIIFVLFNKRYALADIDLLKTNGPLVFILAIYALALIAKKEWPFYQSWYSGIFYICFPLLVGFTFMNEQFAIHKWIILGLIIINWSNDVFAYFTGSLIGKHPLAPGISPKKTIEGAVGGLLASLIAAWLVNAYLFKQSFPFYTVIILGTAVCLAGIIGDLYESKMKRIVGIKDSGYLLPGHGGFLDRFDSFFYIIPIGIFVLSF